MKLSDLYQHSIRYGAALDVRGPEGLRRALEARRQEYEPCPRTRGRPTTWSV